MTDSEIERLAQLGKRLGVADGPTRYAIICPEHGKVFMTKREYDRQMRLPDSVWACPWCDQRSDFDDDQYENFEDPAGPPDTAAQKLWEPDPDDLLPPAELRSREQEQLIRESDERAAFNDHLDNLRREF